MTQRPLARMGRSNLGNEWWAFGTDWSAIWNGPGSPIILDGPGADHPIRRNPLLERVCESFPEAQATVVALAAEIAALEA